ncbi:MAG: hypothetical protein JXL80_12095 [Planctomycetes bacterium]|nr:hypothetical protein [Planctomycetota bacterium]
MAKGRSKPVMTVIFWGGIAVAIMAYGAWCVMDGWFPKPDGPDPQWNKLMAVASFAIAAWVIWQGRKEYRREAARLEAAARASENEGADDSARKPDA